MKISVKVHQLLNSLLNDFFLFCVGEPWTLAVIFSFFSSNTFNIKHIFEAQYYSRCIQMTYLSDTKGLLRLL